MTLTTPQWLALAGLTALIAVALGVGLVALIAERGRRTLLSRLQPRSASAGTLGGAGRRGALADDVLRGDAGRWSVLAGWLDAWVPDAVMSDASAARLARAGMHHPAAPVLLGALRIVLALGCPLVAEGIGLPLHVTALYALPIGLAVGLALPSAVLDRLATRRQVRLRAALPDALDLLVVCLEAGVSLDAALLRVARDLAATHPALAEELAVVNGRVAAGLPRDEALGGMWLRTGVEEVRSIAATLVQGERWGTSLARSLRIHAETLRTRRRQAAEARAAEASVKMIVPLVLFLLPAFFAVVLGPAILDIRSTLGMAIGGP